MLPDVPVQLGHERLAETHDLAVGPPLGVEVAAALAAADRQTGEGVLEDLFEAQELHDAQVDRGMETETALVRPERGVELDPEPAVDLRDAAVVHPRHAEDDLPFGFAHPADDGGVRVLRMLGDDGAEAVEDLTHCLVEFGLAGVPLEHFVIDLLQSGVQRGH